MSLQDDFFIVFRNVSHRKLRAWLTVLGVVIGVAAIVSLVTVSRSLEASIQGQFEEFGSDKITVLSKHAITSFSSNLNTKDVEAVEKVKALDFVAGTLYRSGKIKYRDEAQNSFFFAWPADMSEELFEEFGFEFSDGRAFTTDSNDVVIGPRVAKDMFERRIAVGSKVEIEGERFEVVGILEPVGNPEDDSNIYMPLAVMRDLFGDEESVSLIFAKVKPGTDLNEAAGKIHAELKRIRSEESFDVSTPEQLLEQLGTVLGIVQGVLAGIAAISFIVGAVGITSSVYTSVIERTKDIGIMKAVGATNNEIVLIFLIEAGLVGLVGGVIGIVLGFGIAQLISFAAAQAGFTFFKIVVEPWLMVLGMAFAVVVGMISGFFPARQAAGLKPVEALRK